MNKTFSFDADEAEAYGIHEATFLEELRRWLSHNKRKNQTIRDGRVWSYNTYGDILATCTFIKNVDKLKRVIANLKKAGVLLVEKHGGTDGNAFNRQNWYSIENDIFKVHQSDQGKMHQSDQGKMHQSDQGKMHQCNNNGVSKDYQKVTQKNVDTETPDFSNEKENPENLPHPSNPAYEKWFNLAMGACGMMGKAVNPTNNYVRYAVAALLECEEKGKYTYDQQRELLPRFIEDRQNRGIRIDSLSGILKIKPDTSGHPYGEILAKDREQAEQKRQEKLHQPIDPAEIDPEGVKKLTAMYEQIAPARKRKNKKRKSKIESPAEYRKRFLETLDPPDTTVPTVEDLNKWTVPTTNT